ncbi:MAG: hypothetical protein JNJ83_07740 [Verrucomicrobiaceae bacterium]|nr:hypothetical protein [Verrucomicrobiaceae bacterium]
MKTLHFPCLSLVTFFALASPAWAVDAVVTTLLNDEFSVPSGADVTLTEAVSAVGNSGGKVTFAPSLDGGVIRLSEVFDGTINVVIDATSLPNGITVNANRGKAFDVMQGSSLTLRGLTFRNAGSIGLITMERNCSLNLSDCTFSGNFASSGGSVIFAAGGPSTSVEITRCTFVDNESGDNNVSNSALITGGGALVVYGGGGTVKITNSTFTRNKVGIAKSLNAMQAGGAILLQDFSGNCTLSHCTITNNRAVQGGGGLAVLNSPNATVKVENCLITGNISAPHAAGGADVLMGSFVAANAPNPPFPPKLQVRGVNMIQKLSSQRTDGAFTLVDSESNILPTSIKEAKLAALDSYHGRTQTIALSLGSPAIDRAPSLLGGSDQCGRPRLMGGKCDVGAFEFPTFAFQGKGVEVTTTTDELNDFPPDGTGISLREALTYAGDGSTITFSPSAFNGLFHTIALNAALGPLKVKAGRLIIDATAIAPTADSAGVTVDGGGGTKLMDVFSGVVLEVRRMTFKNGNDPAAGGIRNDGNLLLTECSVEGNTSSMGGGGVVNVGTLKAQRCTFSGNQANVGAVPPVDSGGGALLNQGHATLENCTFSGNSAMFGGAIDQYQFPTGGKPVLKITHCTISGNTANEMEGGGGLYLLYDCTLTDSIISGNTAFPLMPNDVTNNNDFFDQNKGLITAGVNIVPNILTVHGGKLSGAAPLTVDPMLSALAQNGGPTRTMVLLAGSPAIDKATTSLGGDQRGLGIKDKADVGAFEFGTFGTGQFSVNLGDTTPPPPLGRAAPPIVINNGASELTLNLTGNGKFTGTITFQGAKYTFSGQFGQNRTASIQVTGKNLPPFTLDLTLSGAQDEFLQAKVTGASFSGESAGSVAELAPTTKYQAPPATVGRYTARMFDVDTLVCVMAVEITSKGVVKVTGGLYDGTKFTYSTRLRGSAALGIGFGGRIPLYNKKGYLLFGGLNGGGLDFSGTAQIFRPAGVTPAKPASVAGGFNRQSSFSFLRYTPTIQGEPLVAGMATNHAMYVEVDRGFGGASLVTAYNAQLSPLLVLTTAVNGLTLKINRATGVFTGTHPALPVAGQLPTTKTAPIPLYGVLVQNDANAFGYAVGPSASTSYFIELHPGVAP